MKSSEAKESPIFWRQKMLWTADLRAVVAEMYNSFGQVVSCMVDWRREEKKPMKQRR